MVALHNRQRLPSPPFAPAPPLSLQRSQSLMCHTQVHAPRHVGPSSCCARRRGGHPRSHNRHAGGQQQLRCWLQWYYLCPRRPARQCFAKLSPQRVWGGHSHTLDGLDTSTSLPDSGARRLVPWPLGRCGHCWLSVEPAKGVRIEKYGQFSIDTIKLLATPSHRLFGLCGDKQGQDQASFLLCSCVLITLWSRSLYINNSTMVSCGADSSPLDASAASHSLGCPQRRCA
jgi:hypothetical protein